MSKMRRGIVPRDGIARDRAKRRLILACLLPAVIGGGCAQQNSYSQPNWYAGGPPSRQTAAAVPIPVEMEDDGRPAQLPPRVDVRAARDDPSQPWSPNYGGPARQPPPPAQRVSDQAVLSNVKPRQVAFRAEPDE
jgi:hypothetical protein